MNNMLLGLLSFVGNVPEYVECNRINDNDLSFFWQSGWCTALIVATSIVLILYLLTTKVGDVIWKFISRILPFLFVIVWLMGFVVYDVGMYTGESSALWGNSPMAVLHAFGMFILDSDVSAIHEPFQNSISYMMWFSITHLAAAIVSMAFVIKHFGFNIVAGYKRFFFSHFGRKKDRLYIFWGMNDASYILAKSIEEHHLKDKEKDNYRIIEIRSNDDKDSTSVRNGMERLLNFLSLKNKDLDRLRDLNCFTTNTFSSLAELNTTQTDKLKTLRLKSVRRFIVNKTRKDVYMFFLSDDDKANILSVANMKGDKTVMEFAGVNDGRKVRLYCHARFNSIHRVIEDEMPHKNVEINVIDSSHICVEALKQKIESQPANYVTIEKDAMVSSAFNALVVGFGEVGRDAVRFLYEFGAFVKNGSTENNVERSEFHCHVVDKNMDDLAGLMVSSYPGITMSMDFRKNEKKDNVLITLHKMDCLSVGFAENIQEWVKTLNYVVIAMDNDEANMTLAVRIFRLALRYRVNMEHFCIMVRIHNDSGGHFYKISQHHNRLLEAELQSDKNDKSHQKIISVTEKIDKPIKLFGLDTDTYSYDYVVRDVLVEDAKRYKDMYNKAIGNTQSWDDEYQDLMHLTNEYRGFSPTYWGTMRLRRIQGQDISNSLHQLTKQKLASSALGKNMCETLKSLLSREIGATSYSWKEGVTPVPAAIRVLDVLAQTEHLRWNASHEILGYTYHKFDNETCKDESRLQHGCLKPWQELSAETKSYDYNVVDVSLGIINEKP